MTGIASSGGAAMFAVDVVDDGDCVRAAVSGELDLDCPDAFDEAVRACVRERRPLVVDLRETMFIGSQGVAAILPARRQLGDDLGPVTVCVGREIQRRVLQVTGVDSIVRVVEELPVGERAERLTIFEVADELGVEPSVVIRMLEQDDLRGARVGRTTMVSRTEVERSRRQRTDC